MEISSGIGLTKNLLPIFQILDHEEHMPFFPHTPPSTGFVPKNYDNYNPQAILTMLTPNSLTTTTTSILSSHSLFTLNINYPAFHHLSGILTLENPIMSLMT